MDALDKALEHLWGYHGIPTGLGMLSCASGCWLSRATLEPSTESTDQRYQRKNKVGQRTQKQDGTQHAFFLKNCGVGSCALHEIDVRSLLKRRAH